MTPTTRARTVIHAERLETRYLADIWSFRELLYILAWRDLLVRYKQTALGVAWALLRPALTVVAFTLVFSKLAGLPTNGVPPAAFIFAGLLPWQFFATAVSDASNSLLNNSAVISKVYFPRIIVPLSATLVAVADLAIAGLALLPVMLWYEIPLTARALVLPLIILLAYILTSGAGLWLAALNVTYRDFRYLLPFVLQLGLYVSPVGFGSHVVPERWQVLFALNPMVGVIDAFRWALLPGQPWHWTSWLISLAAAGLVLVAGFAQFRRTERVLADVI